jgi:autoinducer 2-degrading protein
MYIVIVDFVIRPDRVAKFHAAVIENARVSRDKEPGCRQFDVAVDPQDPNRYFLYELYDDEAAFRAHLTSDHFRAFDHETGPWIETKAVRILDRVAP